MVDEDVSTSWIQSKLLSGNPFIGSEFFDLYIRTFIRTLLAYDPDTPEREPGILGPVSAYYGCVEAQGRGSLHCHMLIWLEGSLNPNEIRDRIAGGQDIEFTNRLIRYLDDTIATHIPSSADNDGSDSRKVHPCHLRPIVRLPGEDDSSYNRRLLADLSQLAFKTQLHIHSHTCYKYWKGGTSPKTCRFELDQSNVRENTVADVTTGELTLRQLNGLVNPYNPTMLSALRCNMDIKFIGSGASAKAILYYITDYITKCQLKAHIAFGALDAALKKIGTYRPDEDTIANRGKQLLNKCAYAMLSHQELSAQQVASFLMGYGDYYTSHRFRSLQWTQFEQFIDNQYHSSECYPTFSSSNYEHGSRAENVVLSTGAEADTLDDDNGGLHEPQDGNDDGAQEDD
ncbi:hypothetical protein K435DRAFT_686836, partial [Dendrothele bispora CBS 962.96]